MYIVCCMHSRVRLKIQKHPILWGSLTCRSDYIIKPVEPVVMVINKKQLQIWSPERPMSVFHIPGITAVAMLEWNLKSRSSQYLLWNGNNFYCQSSVLVIPAVTLAQSLIQNTAVQYLIGLCWSSNCWTESWWGYDGRLTMQSWVLWNMPCWPTRHRLRLPSVHEGRDTKLWLTNVQFKHNSDKLWYYIWYYVIKE